MPTRVYERKEIDMSTETFMGRPSSWMTTPPTSSTKFTIAPTVPIIAANVPTVFDIPRTRNQEVFIIRDVIVKYISIEIILQE